MYRVHAAGLTRFSRRNLDPVNQHHLDFDLDFVFFCWYVGILVFWFFILAFLSKRLKSKSESIVTPEELNS